MASTATDERPIPLHAKIFANESKTLEAQMADGMAEEQAQEHFSYNIAGAYVGEHSSPRHKR